MEEIFGNNAMERLRVDVLRALDGAGAALRAYVNEENSNFPNGPPHNRIFEVMRRYENRRRMYAEPRPVQRVQEPAEWGRIKNAQARLNEMQLERSYRRNLQQHNHGNNASTMNGGNQQENAAGVQVEQKNQIHIQVVDAADADVEQLLQKNEKNLQQLQVDDEDDSDMESSEEEIEWIS